MDPGVSSATRSAGVAEESLPSGLALAGRQPLLMRVKAAKSAMWIGVENLTRNRRRAELRAVLGITYRRVEMALPAVDSTSRGMTYLAP